MERRRAYCLILVTSIFLLHALPARTTQTGPAEHAAPEQWIPLGTVDPASRYRVLTTLTNRGAAVQRVELSNPKYRDLVDRSGCLGHLVMDGPAVYRPGQEPATRAVRFATRADGNGQEGRGQGGRG